MAQISEESHPRIQLPSQELNRVLGGGLVAGSVVLLAGEPGVGKSTLLLQIAQSMASLGQKVLYVSGEESSQQIKLRAQRLGFDGQGVFLLPETDVASVLKRLDEFRPGIVMVDSIQTLYSEEVPSGPGSVAQVREAGLQLTRWAKIRHVPVFLAGHLTKDGSVAGPRVLEHMVDVVTYLESQEFSTYRILRNSKNRFGSTAEVGVFEMTSQGLADVPDPSRALLSQRYEHAVGSALVPVLEGSRPLLLEVQALTSPTQLPVPRRVGNGVDHNRLLMLAAVASRRVGLELANQDIIVSVAGGFQVSEPAADLAIALAMASSLRNGSIDPGPGYLRGSRAERRATDRAPSPTPVGRSCPSRFLPVCTAGDSSGRSDRTAGDEAAAGPNTPASVSDCSKQVRAPTRALTGHRLRPAIAS